MEKNQHFGWQCKAQETQNPQPNIHVPKVQKAAGIDYRCNVAMRRKSGF